jgi:hypothetical protein
LKVLSPETLENNRIEEQRIIPPAEEGSTTAPGRLQLEATALAGTVYRAKTALLVSRALGGFRKIKLIPKPVPKPQIFIVFHTKVSSFLGNYGAGPTVKSFSMMPGEKTEITVRSYRHKTNTRRMAENVLESVTAFASDSFETAMDQHMNTATSVDTTNTYASEFGFGASIGAEIEGIANIDIGGGGSISNQTTVNNRLETLVGVLKSTVEQHVNETNSHREVEVNTETTETVTTEEEMVTVRQLENINYSRVLNAVFRQLLQEYVTITYIHNVSFVFTNGFPESRKAGKISDFEDFLTDVIQDAGEREEIRNRILEELASIYDNNGDRQSLVEQVSEAIVDPITSSEARTNTYWRIKRDLEQTYNDQFTVPGIIMGVTTNVLKTDSLVLEALLGQGEALDCYNMKLQDAAAERAVLENQVLTQKITIIESIGEATEQVKGYNKVFGDCCCPPDVQQEG